MTREKKYKWLDRNEYPFQSYYLKLQDAEMHYVDEGKGEAVIFVHGTPSWSFDFRSQIKEISKTQRCIAADHIGFGLSDKPEHYNYSIQQHSDNLEALINHLQLKEFTLVIHDFGGPIAMNYAQKYPEKVKRLVILNTWLFSTKNEPEYKKSEFILKSPLLPFLYKYFNFSARMIVPQSWGDKKTLTKEIHQHYLKPFSKPSERIGTIAFAKSLLNNQDLFAGLWNNLELFSSKPALILWGGKDEFVPVKFMEKLKAKLTTAKAKIISAGHFLQDEAHEEVTNEIKKFIQST